MVDPDDKVVIIDINGTDYVLFKSSYRWDRRSELQDFDALISQLGSIEVNGVEESNVVTFTVGGVNYTYSTSTGVITPDLEVE